MFPHMWHDNCDDFMTSTVFNVCKLGLFKARDFSSMTQGGWEVVIMADDIAHLRRVSMK